MIFGERSFCAPEGDFIDDPVIAHAQNAVDVDDEEEIEEFVPPRQRKQRIQLIKRSVFENNNLKDYMNFDMFKSNRPIIL